MPLVFSFRYRDQVTGRWVRARHVATREEIAERYAEFEITALPRAFAREDMR